MSHDKSDDGQMEAKRATTEQAPAAMPSDSSGTRSRRLKKRTRDLADRGGHLNTGSDDLLYQTFRLPLEAARLTVRDMIGQLPQGGYRTIVERWQQLPDRKIEFTVRRVAVSD